MIQIFRGVPWDDHNVFIPADIDSAAAEQERRTVVHVCLTEDELEAKLDELDDIIIANSELREYRLTCRAKEAEEGRLRSCWDMLTRLPPLGSWYPQTREGASRRYVTRQAGELDFNQSSVNKDIWPQVASSAIFHSEYGESRSFDPICDLETGCSLTFGRQLADAVATDIFPSHQFVFFCLFVTVDN